MNSNMPHFGEEIKHGQWRPVYFQVWNREGIEWDKEYQFPLHAENRFWKDDEGL
jgi:hypothetical protein